MQVYCITMGGLTISFILDDFCLDKFGMEMNAKFRMPLQQHHWLRLHSLFSMQRLSTYLPVCDSTYTLKAPKLLRELIQLKFYKSIVLLIMQSMLI